MMHALLAGLAAAAVVGLIACSPAGPVSLFNGSPHRFQALGAMMLLAFIIGALASLAGGD